MKENYLIYLLLGSMFKLTAFSNSRMPFLYNKIAVSLLSKRRMKMKESNSKDEEILDFMCKCIYDSTVSANLN